MSAIRYLLDENVDHALRRRLLGLAPQMEILCIGEPGAPDLGTPDPEILSWLERTGYILVTNNRRTMPGHVRAHLQAGRHLPGVLVLTRRLSLAQAVEELYLLWSYVEEEDLYDLMLYLPLS